MKNRIEMCKTHYVHKEIVDRVLQNIPKQEKLHRLADFFRVFGDATRLKILGALRISELCVCDISELLHTSQSAVSHQLKTLRQAGLVKFRREGKVLFYSLLDDHVNIILDMGHEHINESTR